MIVETQAAHQITTRLTDEQLNELLTSIDSAFSLFVDHRADLDSIRPLMQFKDQLILSLPNKEVN